MKITFNIDIDINEEGIAPLIEALKQLESIPEWTETGRVSVGPAASSKPPTTSKKPSASKKSGGGKKPAAKGPTITDDDPFGAGAAEEMSLEDVKKHAHAWIEQNDMAGMKAILKDEFKLTQLAKMDQGDYPRFVELTALEGDGVSY